jgi:hypothetical protein
MKKYRNRNNRNVVFENKTKQVQHGNALYNVHFENEEGVTLKLFDSYVVPPEELEVSEVENISVESKQGKSVSFTAGVVIIAVILIGLITLGIFAFNISREPPIQTTPPREIIIEEPVPEIIPHSEPRVVLAVWILRLSIVVALIGGVMFWLGFIGNDAEGMSRGVTAIILGGIGTGMSLLVDKFFA